MSEYVERRDEEYRCEGVGPGEEGDRRGLFGGDAGDLRGWGVGGAGCGSGVGARSGSDAVGAFADGALEGVLAEWGDADGVAVVAGALGVWLAGEGCAEFEAGVGVVVAAVFERRGGGADAEGGDGAFVRAAGAVDALEGAVGRAGVSGSVLWSVVALFVVGSFGDAVAAGGAVVLGDGEFVC